MKLSQCFLGSSNGTLQEFNKRVTRQDSEEKGGNTLADVEKKEKEIVKCGER